MISIIARYRTVKFKEKVMRDEDRKIIIKCIKEKEKKGNNRVKEKKGFIDRIRVYLRKNKKT